MFEIDDCMPPPTFQKYPFDELKVGQNFHVPETAEMPYPAQSLRDIVATARRKYRIPVLDENGEPVFETVKRNRRVRGPDGELVAPDSPTFQRQVYVWERDFKIHKVGADDPRGPGARVERIK